MSEPTRTAFALGSNLGDCELHLRQAVRTISSAPGIEGVVVSGVYETDPVGGPEQPNFLNAVVRFESHLSPPQLLELAHRCEDDAGRVRIEAWGARTLDVDVLVVGSLVSDDPALTLPHPLATKRSFVLVPWCDVDPDFVVAGRSVREWLDDVGREGVRATEVDLLRGGQ